MRAVLLAAVLLCLSVAVFAERITIETLTGNHVPSTWVLSHKAHPNTRVKLTIAIKQQNRDRLEEIFWAVSDPTNPAYGKHLTLEELTGLISPKNEDLHAVTTWLYEHDIKEADFTQNNDFVVIHTTVDKAEKLLQPASFQVYRHIETGAALIRSSNMYAVPEYVSNAIDFVGGVIHFPNLAATKTLAPKPDAGLAVTPNLLRNHYNISSTMAKAPNNKQSVAQFIGQFYSPSDLEEFFALFFPSAKGIQPKVIGPDSGAPGVEASLDIEYIMSVGANVPTWFWSTPNNGSDDPFLDWAVALSNTTDAPFLHSVSYGEDESDVSSQLASRFDTEFIKLGVRGLSILFASGDSGVGGSSFGCNKFAPDFPASSPYITAVGGTQFSGFLESGHEITNGLSGGGFSFIYPQSKAPYQTAAVQTFFQRSQAAGTLPSSSYYNPSGRGYPDISALSANFIVVIDRVPFPGVAGTSCAAPTSGGIFSLLNDIRLQNGKSPLGFLNPFIYQTAAKYPGAFFDVTSGSNPGCGTNGFTAIQGWDPATGVGTPNYAILSQVVASLP